MLELREERGVLMIHVRPQKAPLAEREDPSLGKYADHNEHRDKKRDLKTVSRL